MSRKLVPAVTTVFFLTIIVARLISWAAPRFHWELFGVHVHHYVYGIFFLAAAGYFALIFKGPRATAWIAMLYGLGMGLTFDEFGFWFNPPFQRGVRWSYTGVATVIVAGILVSLAVTLWQRDVIAEDLANRRYRPWSLQMPKAFRKLF